jgi:hypothetical protein
MGEAVGHRGGAAGRGRNVIDRARDMLGVTAVIVVAFTTTMPVAAMPPIVTAVAPVRLVPVIVTAAAPTVIAEAGFMPFTPARAVMPPHLLSGSQIVPPHHCEGSAAGGRSQLMRP